MSRACAAVRSPL
uniref:Uncharacterized protein n=1 Tax=Arundo donax TaxID=35708 RepID=A0A0A9F403_ARUDO